VRAVTAVRDAAVLYAQAGDVNIAYQVLGLDAELEPRGSYSLKGVADPLELFALKRG
jgi:hypothetical protein